jgi:cation diffusion facilitator family transporter
MALEKPLLDKESRKPDVVAFDGDPLDIDSPFRKDKISHKHTVAIKKLIIVACISIAFLITEVVGGILSNSLAIFTDAAHMLSDTINYGIGITSIILSRKPAGAKMTFGYNRYEVLGAMLSVFIIWILAAFLCTEAVGRIMEPAPVDGFFMLIVAVLGLFSNIVMGIILIQKDKVDDEEDEP